MDYKEEFKELIGDGVLETSEIDYFLDKSNIKHESHTYNLFKSLIKIAYGNGYIDGIKELGGTK